MTSPHITIGRISGTLIEKEPPQIVVDACGVGYELDVPMSTFCNLPSEGNQVALFTHHVVREDAQLLYGFLTKRERDVFRTVIRVNGVGPKMGLALLSGDVGGRPRLRGRSRADGGS